jgi:hypothetical protein
VTTSSYLGSYLGFAVIDVASPTITIVSPTPDVTPGDAGGFPSDWETARMTPIIARITDAAPGNLYQCVVARWPWSTDEIVVYRRGQFRGQFVALSTATIVGSNLDLSILPAGGWPASDVLTDLTLELDVVDGAGNLAT